MDLGAGPEVGLGVGEQVVGAKLHQVKLADLRVVPRQLLDAAVVGVDVPVAAHQLVEHGGQLGGRHVEGAIV